MVFIPIDFFSNLRSLLIFFDPEPKMNFSAPVIYPNWICNLCKNTNCLTHCLICKVIKDVGEKEWILKTSEVLPGVLPQVLPEVLSEVITSSEVHIDEALSSAPVSPVIVEMASPPVNIVSLASPPVSSPQIVVSDVSRELGILGLEQPVGNTYKCPHCPNKKPYKGKGFLENHMYTVHGIKVQGVVELTIRYIRDNKIEKRRYRESQKVKNLFDHVEKEHQISTMVFNNKTLSPSETFKDLNIKDGDEILVYEVEYPSGEREPSEPAPKRRKTTSSSSSSSSSSNQVAVGASVPVGASVAVGASDAVEVSENNTI